MLAFCCDLRWAAPTPTRPESSKKKKKRAAPDLQPPLKFQVLLEVTSCPPFAASAPLANLSAAASGSRRGVKPLTRCLSCCSLDLFILPSDKMKTFDGSQTRHQPCSHTPQPILISPVSFHTNPSPCPCVNKHAYRQSTHLSLLAKTYLNKHVGGKRGVNRAKFGESR